MSNGKFLLLCMVFGFAFIFFALKGLIHMQEQRTSKYILTSKGIAKGGYCKVGMYISRDGSNVLDENSKPITCTKELRLTKEQFKNYMSKGKL